MEFELGNSPIKNDLEQIVVQPRKIWLPVWTELTAPEKSAARRSCQMTNSSSLETGEELLLFEVGRAGFEIRPAGKGHSLPRRSFGHGTEARWFPSANSCKS
jgi:hypothetical protein